MFLKIDKFLDSLKQKENLMKNYFCGFNFSNFIANFANVFKTYIDY